MSTSVGEEVTYELEMAGDHLYQMRVVSTLDMVNREAWDRCVGPAGSPFLKYDFLRGLEVCECVSEEAGWSPRYLLMVRDRQLVACVSAYRKMHSQGEFIFDWSWADAAHSAGLPYYPKLTVTSPFSPIASEKLLIDDLNVDEADRVEVKRLLLMGLRSLCQREPVTGLHILFASESESEHLGDWGGLVRHTLQFQWTNEDYADFDDFLSRFRAKRRHQIRRERRLLRESGVTVNAYLGSDILPTHIPLIYDFYRATVEKYFYGNLYLNIEFFEHLYTHMREHLCILLAERDGEVIGGSFNLINDGVLYGRYWGCHPDVQVPFLHFEVCAYRGVELCIERGWKRFEAGAGGGGHKFGRGFLPRVIYSTHEVYLPGFKEALTEALTKEREYIDEQLKSAVGEVLKEPNS